MLREFGLELSEDTEVRVWDSTAEVRYLVLPERPQRLDEIHDGHINALIAELHAAGR